MFDLDVKFCDANI